MTDGPGPMPPSDSEGVPAPHDAPRGTCPACGSGAVVHLVIDMPARPEELDQCPDWLHSTAAVRRGFDRACSACGTRWVVNDGKLFVDVPEPGC